MVAAGGATATPVVVALLPWRGVGTRKADAAARAEANRRS